MIEAIIESEEFRNAIENAVKRGLDEDNGYDGENEFSFQIFDENFATWCVIEVIKDKLL